MKTKITFLLAVAFSACAMAQQIATFEAGSTTLGTITGAPIDEQTSFVLDATNPDKTGLNSSDKCLYILSNQVYYDDVTNTDGRPTWNGNVFNITFDSPITITSANRYLHMMHYKESLLSGTWLIFAENGDNNFIEIGRGACPEAGKWFDMMVDFNGKMSTVKTIRVHLDGNWGTDPATRFYPPTKFYYDDIVLNSNSLPRAQLITRSNLLDFEDSSVTNATVTLVTQNAAYSTSLAYATPTSSVNPSSSCAFFKGNTLLPSWWHGLQFTFKSPVDAGTNQYLHIMMKKSASEAVKNVQVSIFNLAGTQSAALMNVPLTTEWVDYVMQIPSTHTIFNQMYIKFNAAAASTECFADEIYIDNSSSPRTNITTALNEAEAKLYNIYSENGKIKLNATTDKEIQIFNISGKRLFSLKSSTLEWTAPSKGLYVVRVNNVSNKIVVD